MNTLKLFNKVKKISFGDRLFTYLLCRKIPFFKSINPVVLELEQGKVIVQIRNRKMVQNHIKTIHPMALCNLCQVAASLLTDVTIPKNLRFIPIGLNAEFKNKAKGTVKAVTKIKASEYKVGNTDVIVNIYDEQNVHIMNAIITWDIKEKIPSIK